MNKYNYLLIALFAPITLFAQPGTDPASCYEPNSAVYDCTMIGVDDGYEDGYADGYEDGAASCVADTVTVVICDYISYANAIEQMADTIANLQYMVAYLESQLADCTDAVEWNFDMIQDLQGQLDECNSELPLVEDEVIYWMESYNDAVDECNDYINTIPGIHCPTDLDNNGVTGASDLLEVLSNFEVVCD